MNVPRDQDITTLMKGGRRFASPEPFRAQARLRSSADYQRLYRESIEESDSFWARIASELHWFEPWGEVSRWQPPRAEWFRGGRTNLCYNCLDRHLDGPRRNKAALIFEGEPGDVRTFTYQQLHREVCKFANVLKGLGVEAGDCVAIYMPMIPELVIAVLACARLGAPHSVVFGGFRAGALRDRINDASARLVVTADGGFRRGKVLPLKPIVDEALSGCPSVESVVSVRRCGNEVATVRGRDHDYQTLMDQASADCPAVPLDSEHPLFILYTSGTTGKPKGIVHTTGGYMVGTYLTTQMVFDLQEQDTYWCTADVGWITGHSYIVYGPLVNGATSLIYEGAPTTPHPGRFWEICERHKVSIFYTAPTAIRSFMKWGDGWPGRYDLSSLRLLGTVGEPINPEAWLWYRKVIGGERCPIVDTWWQTETGSIMISALPGVTETKPGSASKPLFGVVPAVVDEQGERLPPGRGGYLTIQRPWPSMARTIHGDHERFCETYWSRFPGVYLTGDGAHVDADGDFWIMGRLDDVINTSGHRLGSAEIESALVSDPVVAEAAVVGYPHDLKGEAIAAFVTLRGSRQPGADEAERLKEHVAEQISPIARPEQIRFTDALPKTRSGKIMRRLLRDLAAGREVAGDTSTLEDFTVLAQLAESEAE
jgi:acetyl-CoA synthetase